MMMIAQAVPLACGAVLLVSHRQRHVTLGFLYAMIFVDRGCRRFDSPARAGVPADAGRARGVPARRHPRLDDPGARLRQRPGAGGLLDRRRRHRRRVRRVRALIVISLIGARVPAAPAERPAGGGR